LLDGPFAPVREEFDGRRDNERAGKPSMKRRPKWILAALFAGLAVLVLILVYAHHSRKIERARTEFLAAESARIDAQSDARERARERCTFRADAGDAERRVVLDKGHQGDVPQLCSCDDADCCVCY
jgi:flagellar biosynthesis/type III secretory pathway M-ring protein FliF/YscJ